jgi:pimeloyl-ACP methyl ester carboxylesterase
VKRALKRSQLHKARNERRDLTLHRDYGERRGAVETASWPATGEPSPAKTQRGARWSADLWTVPPAQRHPPVVVIGGGKDIVTKREASETIVARLSNTRLKVVADANHMGLVAK